MSEHLQLQKNLQLLQSIPAYNASCFRYEKMMANVENWGTKKKAQAKRKLERIEVISLQPFDLYTST